jgi:hypothetical protein
MRMEKLMHYYKIVSSKTVEQMKQKARKLKREQSITHTQSLDAVAKETGFNHWHEVTLANARALPAEEALKSGYVLAYDVKDGMDIDTSTGLLIEDSYLERLVQDQLYELYRNSVDYEAEPPRMLRDIYPDNELRHYFVSEWSFMYFRLVNPGDNLTTNDIAKVNKQFSFWMPRFVWIKGMILDTYSTPTTDEAGNIEGFRL